MPTNGFSTKPLKVKLLAFEQKATEVGLGGVLFNPLNVQLLAADQFGQHCELLRNPFRTVQKPKGMIRFPNVFTNKGYGFNQP